MSQNNAQYREAAGVGKGHMTAAEVVSIDADLNGLVMGNWLLGAQRPAFRVGNEQTCDAPVDTTATAGQSHRLVELSDGNCRIDLGTAAVGTVWWPHGKETVQGRYFDLPNGTVAEVQWGAMHFRVERTPAPATVEAYTWQERVRRQWATGVSLLGVLLVIGLLAFIPPGFGVIGSEDGVKRLEMGEFIQVPSVPPKEIPTPGAKGGSSPGGGKRSEGPKAPVRKGQASASGNRNTTTKSADASIADARSKGMNALLDQFAAMEAYAGIFSDKNEIAFGEVTGDLHATGPGGWSDGDAVKGTGAGPVEGTQGTGDLRTIGRGCRGSGCAEGVHYGENEGTLRTRRPPRVIIDPDHNTVARGALDKEIVRRVIRSNLNQIRFCYENGLIKTPGLNGRLAVQFVIAGTGSVSTAVIKESSLGNPGVESCVTQAVRRWSFPQRNSGGMTMVTYPFVFAPAGT